MDDVAFIAPDSETMQPVLHNVSELSHILCFQVNSGKTEVYHWRRGEKGQPSFTPRCWWYECWVPPALKK